MKLLLLFLFLPITAYAQWAVDFEMAVGGVSNEPFTEFALGAGHTSFDAWHNFGGVKLQTIYLDQKDEDDDWNTTRVYPITLYLGSRYTISFQNKKDEFRRWGFYPELRLLFIPVLSHTFQYTEEVLEPVPDDGYFPQPDNSYFPQPNNEQQLVEYQRTETGPTQSALDWSWGVGVFTGSWRNYIAIGFETSKIDPLAVMGQMEHASGEIKQQRQYTAKILFCFSL